MSKSREISTVLQRDLIPGGTQYQVLSKANSTDYAVAWYSLTTGNITESNGNLFYSNTKLKTDLQVGVWDINPELGDTYDIGAHDRHWRDIFTNFIVFEGNLRVNNTFFDTANIAEANNLYFTNTRARAAVGAYGSNLVYYESNGNFQVIVTEGGGGGGAVDSVNGLTGTVVLSTTEIPEGANLYFTNARAVAAVTGQDLTLGNITVGNIIVLGETVEIGANSLIIDDPLIYLAGNNYTSDVVDIGFVGNYFDGAQQQHAGLFRDASDGGKFKLFGAYTPEPSVTVDAAHASFMLANLELLNLQVLYDVNTNRILLPYGAANGIVFSSPNAGDYGNISMQINGGDSYLTFYVGDNAADVFKFYAPANADGLQFNDNKVWHAGNDGAGSGLDADLLDGNNSSFYTLTTNQTEGTNLFFTNTRVRAAVGTAAANATGLSYVESTGEFSMADSGVTAGNYGNATLVPQIVVDRYGRITSVSNVAVAGGGGGAVDSVNGQTGVVVLVTDDIAEDGSPVNLWYTDNRAWANTTAGMLVFKTVAVNSVSVVADAWNDTLNLANTTGVTIDGDAGIDTITIGVNGNLQAFSALTAPSTTVAGTGDVQTLTNKTIANVTLTGAVNEQVYNLTGSIIDPDNGTVQEKTVTGTVTFTESFLSGQSLILHLTDGNLYSVTWPTMTWVSSNGNVAPTLANKCVIVFWKIGTTLYGAYVGSFVT